MAEQTQNGAENDQKAFGKRRRSMTTRRGVLIADVISRACIKTGGIGTIVATMIPYSVFFLIFWMLLLCVWVATGLPLGPGGELYMQLGMGN